MPLGESGERERGTIDAEGFEEQAWLGGTVEQVMDLMDDSLGPLDPDAYQIVE